MAINVLDKDAIHEFALRVSNSDMTQYQEISSGSAFYPGRGTPLGLIYCALKLNGEAGELAEHVGKAMRDDKLFEGVGTGDAFVGLELTEERRALIIKEVGDCIWYLAAICRELHIDFHQAATINLYKLLDRQERNKLQGSGDNR